MSIKISPEDILNYFKKRGIELEYEYEDGIHIFSHERRPLFSVSVAGTVIHIFKIYDDQKSIIECIKQKYPYLESICCDFEVELKKELFGNYMRIKAYYDEKQALKDFLEFIEEILKCKQEKLGEAFRSDSTKTVRERR